MVSPTIEYTSDDQGVSMRLRLGARVMKQWFSGTFRSPYNPFVIQVYASKLRRWDDGTFLTPAETEAVEAAIQADPPPGEWEFRAEL